MIGRADPLIIVFNEQRIEHRKGIRAWLRDFVEREWREDVGHCDLPSLVSVEGWQTSSQPKAATGPVSTLCDHALDRFGKPPVGARDHVDGVGIRRARVLLPL